MSMYKKVDTSLNFVEREKQVVEYWNEKKIFEKSMQATEGKEEFSFYDGPPTANGKPHIGSFPERFNSLSSAAKSLAECIDCGRCCTSISLENTNGSVATVSWIGSINRN